jgi:hypothetical protein
MKCKIVPFTTNRIEKAKIFTDQQIGKDYYTIEEMIANQKKSQTSSGELTSFLLFDTEDRIQGIRLAFPAGNWAHGKGNYVLIYGRFRLKRLVTFKVYFFQNQFAV